jgi:hypothetical protein
MSIESFFENPSVDYCKETHLRIKLSIAAYAYEFDNSSIMSDGEFDQLCLKVNLNTNTNNENMDRWFREHFDKSTGQWIHHHPNLKGIKYLYEQYFKVKEV